MLLEPRVGSPLSLSSLRGDLEVAFETVKSWVTALEHSYYLFGLRPYSRRVQRGLKRERKLYPWDWSECREESARFEAMVVSHLRKACHAWTDFGRGKLELFYVRDNERREIDGAWAHSGRAARRGTERPGSGEEPLSVVMPEGSTVLIGQTPLETLDLIVDPRSREVAVNPASPDMPLLDLLRAS